MNVKRFAVYRAVISALSEPSMLACSGGIDSSVLVVLAALATQDGCAEPVVVYIDHLARPGSSSEGSVVVLLAERFGLRSVVSQTTRAGQRSESAMRHDRYSALAAVGASLGMRRVLTGHTRDDQVETVLMRLLSGSGGTGSAGMRPEQRLRMPEGDVDVLRPLLETSRNELEAIASAFNLSPIQDESNDDRSIRRNAIRLEIVPRLRAIVPGFEDALLRSVRLSADDAELLDAMAHEQADQIAVVSSETAAIDREAFTRLHPALSSRVVRIVATHLIDSDDNRELTEERIRAVVAAASGRSGAIIELPYGFVVEIGRKSIEFKASGT